MLSATLVAMVLSWIFPLVLLRSLVVLFMLIVGWLSLFLFLIGYMFKKRPFWAVSSLWIVISITTFGLAIASANILKSSGFLI